MNSTSNRRRSRRTTSADDAEVDDRDRRDLRVGDLGQRVPDLGFGYHVAPGTERRTSVISFHSCSNSGTMAVALVDERAQLLERLDVARLVLEPLVPHLRVHPVVRLLAVDLGGEASDPLVVGLHQRLDPLLVGLLVEHLARDRPRPVGNDAQLDELRAAVLLGLAVERELVGGRAELLGDELVERACVPDLVLRDRREGHVLLEERRDPRPLGVPPAEDQLVVSDRQEQLFPLAHVPPSASP